MGPSVHLQIFQQLVVLLGSDSNVVHTYAAVAVERLLAQKVRFHLLTVQKEQLASCKLPILIKMDASWLASLRIEINCVCAQEGGKQRFQVQDLAPVLEPLLSALFSAFLKPDSAENEYVMRCIMRVIDFVGPEVSSMLFAFVTLLRLSHSIS